jgi:FAD:protein FMN transferase
VARLRFEAIGTHWDIDIPGVHTPTPGLTSAIDERITSYAAVYSRFLPDSRVSTMAGQTGTYTFPPDSRQLFELYRRLYSATDHAVTPLIGQTMSQAGYDADYSFVQQTLASPPAWDETIHYDPATCSLQVRRPILLDIGAAGKGHLVDLVAEVLRTHGITQFTIDAGGDILCQQPQPETIGLEHPTQPGKIIGHIALATGSICGSASNRRSWGDMHHIIDPRTLRPVRDILATWVIASSALVADGLATALFFAAPESLRKIADFEYVVVHDDMSVTYSATLPGTIYD